MPKLDVESARASLRSMPPGSGAEMELASKPTVQRRNATMQEALQLANEVKASMIRDGRGGGGWGSNAGNENNHCGQIAGEAAERLIDLARKRGYQNISVGVAQSKDGNFWLREGMHAVTVMYVGGPNKVITVDSWAKPPKVETPPFKVTGEMNGGKFISVWPTSVPRKDGFHGNVNPVFPQPRRKEDTSKSPDIDG